MNFFTNLAAIFMAPFLAFSAFFGLNHAETSAPPVASSTATASTTVSASSTPLIGIHAIHLPGSNGGVRLPFNPGGLMIPYPATTTPTSNAPVITSESVTSGTVGTEVTLNGSGFTARSIVHFAAGAVQHTTVSVDGTKLSFAIPSSLGAYCKPDQACPMYEMLVTNGTYKLYVENVPATGDATGPISNTVDFTVIGSANIGL